MKKVIKILAAILWTTLGLALILLIVYGIRELKLYMYGSVDTIATEEIHNQAEELTEEDKEITDTPEIEDAEPEEIPSPQDEFVSVAELVFAGDVLFPDYLLSVYDKDGIMGLMTEEVKKELENADITMVNQEFPFSTIGEAMQDKQYTFRIAPERVGILKEMGIDIVTIANNHTLDYGNEALLETIATLEEAEIAHVGAGKNLEEAKRPVKVEIEDMTIGFIGASRVIPVAGWNATAGTPGMFTTYDPTTLLEEIEEAKKTCDMVILYVHWGIERNNRPEGYQRELAKQYIDKGADMVVGSHPHVMQGIEYYQGKPIVYSLGNFIFGRNTKETGILKVGISEEKELKLSLIPCTMEGTIMKVMEEEQGKKFFEYLSGISYGALINKQGEIIEN